MFFHRYSILNDLIGNFWVAPEFLRGTADVTDSSSQQAADVYAAAIIIKEVFARNGPYTEYQEDFAYKPEGGSQSLAISSARREAIVSITSLRTKFVLYSSRIRGSLLQLNA